MIVFDIETYKNLEQPEFYRNWKLSEMAHKGLTDPIKKKQNDIINQSKFALSPLTGKVVCFCLLSTTPFKNSEVLNENEKDKLHIVSRFSLTNEKELLSTLWDSLADAIDNGKRLVTYNGINFDIPFIVYRSAVLNIPKPTHLRISELTSKYNSRTHLDLYNFFDEGKMAEHAYQFGCSDDLSSDGYKVESWIDAGQHGLVIRHCIDDVIKTLNVYQRVKEWTL